MSGPAGAQDVFDTLFANIETFAMLGLIGLMILSGVLSLMGAIGSRLHHLLWKTPEQREADHD